MAVASVAFSTPPSPPPVAYDPAPTAVIASFREELGEVADPDPGPSVEVFGDGRVVAHFPRYMTRAGNWTGRLSADEVQRLLRTLIDEGVLDLDVPAARARLARARAARAGAARRGETTLFEASDPSRITIVLRAGGRARTVTWRGLRADAWAHPDLSELQRLRRAHDTLRALAEAPGLTRAP